jgi:hypothetical protein
MILPRAAATTSGGMLSYLPLIGKGNMAIDLKYREEECVTDNPFFNSIFTPKTANICWIFLARTFAPLYHKS